MSVKCKAVIAYRFFTSAITRIIKLYVHMLLISRLNVCGGAKQNDFAEDTANVY